MGKSKVIYNGEIVMDLTGDDVKPDKLLKGIKAHDSNGDPIVGTCEYDFDTSEMTATAAEILADKTAAVKGSEVKGTMKNNGTVAGKISTKDGEYTVPQGYHDGSGKVAIDPNAVSDLIPENIRDGHTILGILGSMTGNESEKPQPPIEVYAPLDPLGDDLIVAPSDGYTCLTKVVVKKVPYQEIDNTAQGKGVTVIIG